MTTSVSLIHKAEILILVNLKSPNEGCTKTPKTTRFLLMNIIGWQSTFLLDVDYKIKKINMKKEFMEAFRLQNLKDLSSTTSKSDGIKRNYTPPAISEFKLQTLEFKKQTETPTTKSDFKSKVRPQTHVVNILQCVSTDSATGPRGEDCTDCYSSNSCLVTVTAAAASVPFKQGQCAS